MGYLSDGRYIVTEDHGFHLQWQISQEIEQVYEVEFSKGFIRHYTDRRFFALSGQEQNDCRRIAGIRVQDRNRGGLVV